MHPNAAAHSSSIVTERGGLEWPLKNMTCVCGSGGEGGLRKVKNEEGKLILHLLT